VGALASLKVTPHQLRRDFPNSILRDVAASAPREHSIKINMIAGVFEEREAEAEAGVGDAARYLQA